MEKVNNNENEMEQLKVAELEKQLGITEVKLSSQEGLVFFAGCHCSNGNKVAII